MDDDENNVDPEVNEDELDMPLEGMEDDDLYDPDDSYH
jgi:hypothetical protein